MSAKDMHFKYRHTANWIKVGGEGATLMWCVALAFQHMGMLCY